MSTQKRKYEMRSRADRQAETRQRIAAAAAELHEEVGPARTTVAEIARRAGVQRLTVYNNFPNDHDLFAACQRHFFSQNPPPNLAVAFELAAPGPGLELLLGELYGWYRRNERMSTNVRRDRGLVPALDAIMTETADAQLAAVADAVLGGVSPEPGQLADVRATIVLSLDFWTWRRLAQEGVTDERAARLMASVVLCVAGRPDPRAA